MQRRYFSQARSPSPLLALAQVSFPLFFPPFPRRECAARSLAASWRLFCAEFLGLPIPPPGRGTSVAPPTRLCSLHTLPSGSLGHHEHRHWQGKTTHRHCRPHLSIPRYVVRLRGCWSCKRTGSSVRRMKQAAPAKRHLCTGFSADRNLVWSMMCLSLAHCSRRRPTWASRCSGAHLLRRIMHGVEGAPRRDLMPIEVLSVIVVSAALVDVTCFHPAPFRSARTLHAKTRFCSRRFANFVVMQPASSSGGTLLSALVHAYDLG